ncbi:MAG: HAMP domain-containing histidine kinase [Lachnospiraceae bacterium]|nr:HAMP domain-containing histidine kinase [Lachnospiraceae bacterium]MDE6982774.1 HAMP domain-containing histidine kinase [Lachnospiraceae bacterium]
MYKKLHRRLTLIFSGITAGILITMSLFYLYLYEKDVTENSFLSFSQEVSSIILNLQQQENFSSLWQASVFTNSLFLPAFFDRDVLLPSCALVLDKEERELAEEACAYGFSLYPSVKTYKGHTPSHKEFVYKTEGKPDFYVSAINLPKNSGSLTGVILYNTLPLRRQILHQRLRFAMLNVLGIFCLCLFSWFYTGKLLAPIQASHENQNAFIAAASHELRTPLAVILSAVSATKKASPGERETFLGTIETESRRMSLLVNDMLTLSRADNHTFLLHSAPAELDTLLVETWEAFRPLAREHQMHLEILLPENSVSKCPCDQDRIRQVLEILISNALSYCSQGGRISLTLEEKTSRFLLGVRDTGTGIPDKDKPYIFDRFYRGDASRSAKDHFGLGLCIAKEIMDAHLGKIWVEDTPGGGASFFLELKK